MSEDNKIVAAKFADNNPKQIVPADTQAPQRLNVKAATEIGGALERWHALRANKIATPTADAELAGLTEYLANQLLTYAPELLGCWFVVRNEYEPLVNSAFTLLSRVDAMRAQRAQAAQCQCQGTLAGPCCDKQ
jgi:hypothetical protein